MTTTDLDALMNVDLPEGRGNLLDSYMNLERVAEYCESNYFGCENKRAALEETKGYTTQSLASVAYQINTLAYNFLQMLDLQGNQIGEMESQVNHISQTVAIHKEKVARREIGVLTTNKNFSRQYKIIAPASVERPVKYVRRKIDYSVLDDIGHGVVINLQTTPRQKRPSTSGSTHYAPGLMGGVPGSNSPLAGPAPTTKPPTPPSARYSSGTLSRSKEYRTLPIVAPPQVPSNYAPNYPSQRSSKQYGTLPHHGVAMVHPMQTATEDHYATRASGSTMPRLSSSSLRSVDGHSEYRASRSLRSGESPISTGRPSQRPPSPPLPPPPGIIQTTDVIRNPEYAASIRDAYGTIETPQSVKQEPAWVPKNFIDKVVAIYDYSADKEDELSFTEGSVIYVLKKNDDGWWEGVMNSVTGLFPGNYVESM